MDIFVQNALDICEKCGLQMIKEESDGDFIIYKCKCGMVCYFIR